MAPIGGRRPQPPDVVLAVVLTITGQLEVWAPQLMPGVGEVTGSRPLLSVTTAMMTVPLVARRVAPLAVLATALTAAASQSLLTTPTDGLTSLAVLLVAAYSVSAYAPWRQAVAGAAVLVVGVAFIGQDPGDDAFLAVVLGGAWLTGFVVGQRSGEVARLTTTNRDLAERLAAASTLLSAAEERAAVGRAPAPEDLAVLTARELDVVRAIATGRSNAEIASLLVISEWTVKSHVASILRKLGLRDRAQVVVAAYEAGLVLPGKSGP
jgi:DNA-binding CsgD family transcriptional regulator